MHQVILYFPEEATLALKLTPDELGEEIKLAAAIKLYELGKLSSGAASQLAGVSKTIFLSKLADYDVSTFKLTKEELLEDLNNA